MGKNEEVRFGTIPPPEVPRSVFDLSHGHMTSFNVGELIPIDWLFVQPGDTIRQQVSQVVRLQTMLTPTFSNIELEVDSFFIPMRLTWDHTKEFYGENTTSPWIQSVAYEIPAISSPSGGFASGTLADYFGLPVGVQWSATDPGAPMALPFRAYAQMINDWWNWEVLNYPLNVPKGDSNQTGTNGSSFINDIANGGKPFIAAKYFDLFSSSLPAPQKGTSVTFPLISGSLAPVKTSSSDTVTGVQASMLFRTASNGNSFGSGYHNVIVNSSGVQSDNATITPNTPSGVYPSNLYADLSTSVGAVTVNELRLAFQLQKFYEKCARGGLIVRFSGLHVKKIEEKNWKAALNG